MANQPSQVQGSCIFCQIVSGAVQSKKVYEDDTVVGVLDINPANPGHVLLMPRQHHQLMMQIPSKDIAHMFLVAKKISVALLKVFGAEGTNIFAANGSAAGQKAPHFILHIIPRIENDGLNFQLAEKDMDDTSLEQLRQKIVPAIKERFGLTDKQVAGFYDSQENMGQMQENMQTPSSAHSEAIDSRKDDKGNGSDLDKIADIFR